MSSSNARLIVEIAASISQFREDLGKAAGLAEANAKRIDRAFKGVKTTLATLTGGLGLAAIADSFRGVVKAAEDLQSLSEATGSSVESLSRLSNIAKVGGEDFATLQTAIERLAAGMAGSEEGSTKTAEALRFLGVQSKDPAAALEEIAVKLNSFSDGVGKAAIARDLFGRQGVAFLSTLRNIAEAGDQVSTVTTEQALQAKRLGEAFRSLEVSSAALRNELASALVPKLADLLEQFREGKQLAGGFWEAIRLFGLGISPFDNLAESLRKVRLELEQLEARKANQGLIGQLNSALGVGPDFDKLSADAKKKLEFLKFMQRQEALALISPANEDSRDIRARTKPPLPYVSGGQQAAADTARKQLDLQLHVLDAYAAREREILSDRLSFLDDYYQHDEIGITENFETRRRLLQDNLEVTKRTLDQEIALLRARQSQADPKESADLEIRILDIKAKIAKAEHDTAIAGVQSFRQQGLAVDALRSKIEDVSISLAELAGQHGIAARARFDKENQADIARLNDLLKAGSDEQRRQAAIGLSTLSRQREQLGNQGDLNDESDKFSRIMGEIDIAQRRINIAQSSGAITELEALRRTSDLDQSRIADLQKVADEYENLARKAKDPRAIQAAEELKVKIEELAAAGDLVAKKFNDIFSGAFADAIASVADGTKTLKDAVKDMERSIVSSISRIAAQNIAESVIGKNGPLSGLGDIFSGLFGGKGGAATLSAAGTTLTTAGAALNASAAALSGAAAALGASGIASGFGAGIAGSGASSGNPLFDMFFGSGMFGFANGGDPPLGRASLVGERGPELFVPKVAGTIIPNEVLRARRAAAGHTINVTNYIQVPSGTSRATADQMAVKVAAAVNRGVRKAG